MEKTKTKEGHIIWPPEKKFEYPFKDVEKDFMIIGYDKDEVERD